MQIKLKNRPDYVTRIPWSNIHRTLKHEKLCMKLFYGGMSKVTGINGYVYCQKENKWRWKNESEEKRKEERKYKFNWPADYF